MTQSLEQFRQRVLQDSNLSEQFKTVSNPDEFANLAVQLGQQLGYSFTADEVKKAIAQQSSAGETQELNDAQLEAIAGGSQYGATDGCDNTSGPGCQAPTGAMGAVRC